MMSVIVNTDLPLYGGCQRRAPVAEQRFIQGRRLTLQKIKVFRTLSEGGELLSQPKGDILKHRIAQVIIGLQQFNIKPNLGIRPTVRDELLEQFQLQKYESIERLKDVCTILQKIESIDRNRDRMRTMRHDKKSEQEQLELILLSTDNYVLNNDVNGRDKTPTMADTAYITGTDTTFSSVEHMNTDSEIESPTSDSCPDTDVYNPYTFMKTEFRSEILLEDCLLDLGIPETYNAAYMNNDSSVTSFNYNMGSTMF